jgi:hypothetical protein
MAPASRLRGWLLVFLIHQCAIVLGLLQQSIRALALLDDQGLGGPVFSLIGINLPWAFFLTIGIAVAFSQHRYVPRFWTILTLVSAGLTLVQLYLATDLALAAGEGLTRRFPEPSMGVALLRTGLCTVWMVYWIKSDRIVLRYHTRGFRVAT